MMSLFVVPEVQRRQKSGALPKAFTLYAAQVLFHADRRAPLVRLNGEVQARAKANLDAASSKAPGDTVLSRDIVRYDKIQLAPIEDPDCAHLTALRIRDGWQVAFDFRYSKGLARKHADTADQFLRCAEGSYRRRDWRAFIDTLFSAAELTARAQLLMYSQVRCKTNHKCIKTRFCQWAHYGNADTHESKALKRLGELRSDARYIGHDVSLDPRDALQLLRTIREMVRELSEELP